MKFVIVIGFLFLSVFASAKTLETISLIVIVKDKVSQNFKIINEIGIVYDVPLHHNTNRNYSNKSSFRSFNNSSVLCALNTSTINGITCHGNTRFSEIIMWNRGKENILITEIEENQISFWNL